MKTYRDIEKRDFERLQRNHDALLAALQACIACGALERKGNDANAQNAADQARAAIRQAKGETT